MRGNTGILWMCGIEVVEAKTINIGCDKVSIIILSNFFNNNRDIVHQQRTMHFIALYRQTVDRGGVDKEKVFVLLPPIFTEKFVVLINIVVLKFVTYLLSCERLSR